MTEIKKKQTKITQKKKQKILVSNISETEKIFQDLMKLIFKYSGVNSNVNVTSYTTPTDVSEGYYLMFLKRNEKDQQRRLQITEFSKNINVQDLTATFSDILNNHIRGIENYKQETIN